MINLEALEVAVGETPGADGPLPGTPAAWFAAKYPSLEKLYGAAVEEVFPEGEKKGKPHVKDLSEDVIYC